jgi:hypothetical protein
MKLTHFQVCFSVDIISIFYQGSAAGLGKYVPMMLHVHLGFSIASLGLTLMIGSISKVNI